MCRNDLKKEHRANLIQALSERLLWKRRGGKSSLFGRKFDRSLRGTFRAFGKSQRTVVRFASGTLLRCFRVTITLHVHGLSLRRTYKFMCTYTTRRCESRQLTVWLTSVVDICFLFFERTISRNRNDWSRRALSILLARCVIEEKSD